MKTSDVGRKLIEDFEGLFLQAYDDATEKVVPAGSKARGVITIGYGHTTAAGPPRVYPGMTITKDQADQILAADLASVEIEVDHLVKVPLTQNQFDALVSFHFNTGALGRSTVLKDVNAKNFAAVPRDLGMWVRAGGKVLQGLVRRRKAEADLFMKVG